MKRQLVYFTGCPYADAARAALHEALAAAALEVAVEEIDTEIPDARLLTRRRDRGGLIAERQAL